MKILKSDSYHEDLCEEVWNMMSTKTDVILLLCIFILFEFLSEAFTQMILL